MQKLSSKESAKRFLSTLVMTSLVVPGILLQVPEARATGTLSGQVITNRATATYQDAAGLNTFTSDSNDVTTTVGSVFSLTLSPSGTEASPGQTQNAIEGALVSFPYTLTNTGNFKDSYTITSLLGATSSSKYGTLANMTEKVYFDANNNGIIDSGDTVVYDASTSTSTATPTIDPDKSISLIATYKIQTPISGPYVAGDKVLVDVKATSVGDTAAIKAFDDTNFNQTVFSNDATVKVTKAVDKANGDPSTSTTSDILTYSFDANNTGNKTATGVIIVDSVPTNTRFVLNSVTGAATTVEYDTTTTSGTFVPVTAGVFSAGLTPVTAADALLVKRIRFTFASLPANNNRTFGFQVRMNENTPATVAGTGVPVNIVNLADYEYTNNAGTKVGDSNTSTGLETNPAVTAVNPKSASLISFSGTPFIINSVTQGTGGTQSPIFDAITSDRTTQLTSAAGSYVYFKNVVTNNGNARDKFDITVDPLSTLPTGASVSFFIFTDPTAASNNSPLLDTDASGVVDTGFIEGQTPTAGSVTASTPNSFTIVSRVFIPAGATISTATTTPNAVTIGQTAFTVADASKFHPGDKITVAGQPLTIASISGSVITTSTAATAIAVAGAAVNDLSVDLVVDATSRNGGTAISTAAGSSLTDSTANILGSIVAPNVTLLNNNKNISDSTADTFTESSSGAPVSFPLNVTNTGSSNDTFNLTASLGTLPSGSVATFYPVISSTVLTAIAADGKSVTIPTGTPAVGDNIIINGQTLKVGTVVGTTVTFVTGQVLADKTLTDTTVTTLGNTPITSSGSLAPAATLKVVAVITVPAGALPVSAPVSFTATSTNNSTIVASQPNTVVIPAFRTYTFTADRSGTAPQGGTLSYIHTITNNGNSTEKFDISIPADVVGGMSYTLYDSSNAAQGDGFSIASLAPGTSATFTLKVTVPTNFPLNATDIKVITVNENSATLPGGTKTNQDQTKVIDGLISLVKTAETFTATGTPATDANGTLVSVDSTGATAKPGQIIEYRIKYTNIGGQTAKSVIVTDHIPANTDYVPGSLRKGSTIAATTFQTDAVDADKSKTVGAPVTEVDFNLDSSTTNDATASAGGSVTQGDSGFVVFRVKVK